MIEIDFDPEAIPECVDAIAADRNSAMQVLIIDGKLTMVPKEAVTHATELAFKAAAHDAASRLPSPDFDDFDAEVKGQHLVVTLKHASGATATGTAPIVFDPTAH